MKYPVFALKEKDNLIYVFFKEKDLKITNTDLLRKNIFKKVTLIDASGEVYKIKYAFKIKDAGFFGFSLLKKGKQVLIDFEFEGESTNISISQFKQDIKDKIDRNKNFWQSAWNISELKEKINKSTSFREIADLIK